MAYTRENNATAVAKLCIFYLFVKSFVLSGVSSGLLSRMAKPHNAEELASTVVNLTITLNIQPYQKTSTALRYRTLVTVSHSEMLSLAQILRSSMSNGQFDYMFIDYVLNTEILKGELLQNIFQIFDRGLPHTSTIILFSNNVSDTVHLIETMCLSIEFKWTHLIHTVEWILVSRYAQENHDTLHTIRCSCIDFFTYIVWSEKKSIGIWRKSRGIPSTVRRKLIFSSAWSSRDLQNVFPEFTRPKNTRLDGLHLKVGFVEGDKKFTDIRRTGQMHLLEGYSLVLLQLLSAYLKFTFRLVTPADQGEYGSAHTDGRATGITGLLARKEIGLTCMGLSKTEDRNSVIDFVDSPIFNTPIFITYKLPDEEKITDFTLINIIHWDFFIACLGPVLIIVTLGGMLHVFTKSCSLVIPEKVPIKEIRRLATFPDRICFQEDTDIAGQGGRVLQTSWALFWLIIGASYSAYLVTSFTVKRKELKIDTLQKLLETPEYHFGLWKLNSALENSFSTAPGGVMQATWQKIVEFNKTDASTISPNITIHILHILSGNYALIDDYHVEDISTSQNFDYSKIRSHQFHSFDSLAEGYIAVPKNAFHRDIVNLAIIRFEEAGILQYLREKYNIVHRETSTGSRVVMKEETSVVMSRILVIVYITFCCIAVAMVCLILEWLCSMHVRRKIKWKSQKLDK